MRTTVFVLLAGCGRIGFDADVTDATLAIDVPPDLCPANLVTDGGFEDGGATWLGNDSLVTQITDAHTGAFSGRGCRTLAGALEEYGVRAPVAVAAPAIGTRYHLTATIRLSRAMRGGLKIRMRKAGVQLEEGSAVGPLGTDWSPVDFFYTVGMAAADQMFVDIEAQNGPADPSYCVDADDVCLTQVP